MTRKVHLSIATLALWRDAMQAAMNDALTSGYRVLAGVGSSLDAHGTVMMSFNTTGMGRGYVGADGKPVIMFTANDTK